MAQLESKKFQPTLHSLHLKLPVGVDWSRTRPRAIRRFSRMTTGAKSTVESPLPPSDPKALSRPADCTDLRGTGFQMASVAAQPPQSCSLASLEMAWASAAPSPAAPEHQHHRDRLHHQCHHHALAIAIAMTMAIATPWSLPSSLPTSSAPAARRHHQATSSPPPPSSSSSSG